MVAAKPKIAQREKTDIHFPRRVTAAFLILKVIDVRSIVGDYRACCWCLTLSCIRLIGTDVCD